MKESEMEECRQRDGIKKMKELYEQLGISSQVYDFCHEIEESLKERFEQLDKTAEYNQMKVLLAMQKNRVSEECFGASSGYGYNDFGRDTLEKVYADTFHTEACLVRPDGSHPRKQHFCTPPAEKDGGEEEFSQSVLYLNASYLLPGILFSK